MTYRIAYAKPAEKDLDEIEEYLRDTAGDKVADEFIIRVVDKVNSLRNMPERQRVRLELKTDLRAVSVRSYLIFYRIEAGTVTIVRVLHGSRDIHSKLFGR